MAQNRWRRRSIRLTPARKGAAGASSSIRSCTGATACGDWSITGVTIPVADRSWPGRYMSTTGFAAGLT